MTCAANLSRLGDNLSAAYHRYLVDPDALPEFLAAGEAYRVALRARHSGFWERLESGPFMVPVALAEQP
jgi:hypothetical protein